MRFARQVVVVTGAAGGLGSAMCRRFLAEGARVIAADVVRPTDTGGAEYLALDVSAEEAWTEALDEVQRRYGGLDVLVNNAGIFRPNIAFEDMPLELWRRHFAVNSDGTFLGCKHGILHMKAKGGGAIVNIASGMGIKAYPQASAYCASKAAVLMTTRTAATAGGPYGIRVNAVLPGAVPTAMLMGNLVEHQSEEELIGALRRLSPLGRLASPDDIAHAVLFLADPQNMAVSGVLLPVDCANMPGG
jgi:NAD(P)-dependent dehydrogenase (short-subunit alcohol dehydrogenase family)